MQAIELKSNIKNNQIKIPAKLQSELKSREDKDVRLIVLIDDSERADDFILQQTAQLQQQLAYTSM